MKKLLTLGSSLLLAGMLIGCGGGSGSDNNNNNGTTVTAVDGYIKNATVKDALGKTATYIGNGKYKFSSAPTYPITLTGGLYIDTNESFDINLTTYTGSVISPITTLIANGDSDFLTMFANALNKTADIKEFVKDYIENNDTNMSAISQYAYLIIKENLKSAMKATANSISSIDDFKNALTTAVNNHISDATEKAKVLSFVTQVATLQSSGISPKDFETHLKTYKSNLHNLNGNGNLGYSFIVSNTSTIDQNKNYLVNKSISSNGIFAFTVNNSYNKSCYFTVVDVNGSIASSAQNITNTFWYLPTSVSNGSKQYANKGERFQILPINGQSGNFAFTINMQYATNDSNLTFKVDCQ